MTNKIKEIDLGNGRTRYVEEVPQESDRDAEFCAREAAEWNEGSPYTIFEQSEIAKLFVAWPAVTEEDTASLSIGSRPTLSDLQTS